MKSLTTGTEVQDIDGLKNMNTRYGQGLSISFHKSHDNETITYSSRLTFFSCAGYNIEDSLFPAIYAEESPVRLSVIFI